MRAWTSANFPLFNRVQMMNIVDKALATQIANIQTRTGKSLDQLYAIIRKSGFSKHGQIRDMLKADLGMGHGDANTLVHTYFQASTPAEAKLAKKGAANPADELYTGPKEHLRPIHDKLMAAIDKFGEFEIAPK